MAAPGMPDEVVRLLERPNPAVISMVRPDGQPMSVPTWYLWEAGRVMVNMDAGRRRLAYLRQEPRVSVTVLDGDDWHSHVTLRGRADDIHDDADLVDIDRLCTQYRGSAYPVRTGRRVTACISVEGWHGWGRFKTA